jgi:ATP-dependent exoDNAse (exonuclease V) alpha subunit
MLKEVVTDISEDAFNASAIYFNTIDKVKRTLTVNEAKELTGVDLKELILSNDVPVIITDNINVEYGVVNGAQGTVKGYISYTGNRVDVVLVELVNKGRNILNLPDLKITNKDGSVKVYQNTYPITRSQKPWRTWEQYFTFVDGNRIKKYIEKSEFPLVLAYAMTIHKAEGQTREHIIIDLKKPLNGLMPYTALSRCTTRNGFRLTQAVDKKEVNAFSRCIEKDQIDKEIKRLEALQERVFNGLSDEIKEKDKEICDQILYDEEHEEDL